MSTGNTRDHFAENTLNKLRAGIERSLLEAAEPVIQQALKDVEAKMRAALGRNIVGLLEHQYSIVHDQHSLRIEVRLPTAQG